jgi:hypothetical protein
MVFPRPSFYDPPRSWPPGLTLIFEERGIPVRKKRKAEIDLGPLETIADCQQALRALTRACAAGENVNLDDCRRAGDVIGELMRSLFAEEQRIERRLRGHDVH